MTRWLRRSLLAPALILGACVTAPAPAVTDTAEMTRPAYLIVLGDVHDREAFMTGYAAQLGPLYEAYGGEYIALGGGPDHLEGEAAPSSYVISKWPSMEAARAFWNSPEYDTLRRARIDNGWGDFEVVLVEGLPEPAPQ